MRGREKLAREKLEEWRSILILSSSGLNWAGGAHLGLMGRMLHGLVGGEEMGEQLKGVTGTESTVPAAPALSPK